MNRGSGWMSEHVPLMKNIRLQVTFCSVYYVINVQGVNPYEQFDTMLLVLLEGKRIEKTSSLR